MRHSCNCPGDATGEIVMAWFVFLPGKNFPAMKKTTPYLFAFLFALCTTSLSAQERPQGKLDNFAIGYHLNQYQNDFGIGLDLTSPLIAQCFVIRAKGNVQWLQNTHAVNAYQQGDLYTNARIVFPSRNMVIPGKLSV